jgi:hypothetical protein
MAISVSTSGGNFADTVARLRKLQNGQVYAILDKYGPIGVSALAAATPKTTGETALSWYYDITKSGEFYQINWNNRHVVNGANIALLINYGHGTGTGGYVPGRPYIMNAMAPIFARIILEVQKAVKAS